MKTLTATILLFTMAATVPAQTIWYVDGGNPSCPGSGTQADPFCLIQDAIDAASDGDTIEIAPFTYTENLLVNRDLLLVGPGGAATTVIDGGLAGTVVRILSGQIVKIDGITITNGLSGTEAGGISNLGGTLTLTNSTVTGNQGRHGGGLESEDGFTTIRNSTFSYNQATYGGGIMNYSRYVPGATVAVYDSLLYGNEATVGYGGAIGSGVTGGEEIVLLVDSVFTNNVCSGRAGGAIQSVGQLTILDCDITDNLSVGVGGGIFMRGGDCTLTNSTVTGNEAMWGGGVYSLGELTIVDSEISGNSAAGWAGGVGDYNWGFTRLVRSTVAGNDSAQGGGVMNVNNGNTVSMDHSIVAGNVAPSGPDCWGELVSQGYNLVEDLQDCTVSGDPTGNLLGVDPLFADPLNGDYSLQETSPCVDAGDPALALLGLDAGGFPRFLDGDLDRVQVLDIGAHEFSNVHFAISGDATPGGSVTVTTTGRLGLVVFLWIGTAPGEFALPPYGSLFFDPSSYWDFWPFAVIPDTEVLTVPASVQVPVTVYVQEMAVNFFSKAGNTSNPIELLIQ